MKSYDAVVIGGGPAGITAAMYLARSGCSVLMPEQLAPGGQILQTEAMDNYPGFPKGIKGYELADLFAAHLEGLAIDRPAAAVESVSGSAGQFVVRAGGVEYGARTVVVCSGAHHRKLGLEGEDRLRGRGVSYCALCDGNFFRNQTVAVVGGGVGCAIAYPTAKKLHELGAEVHSVVGFRNKDLVILEKEFETVSAQVVKMSDDGSWGEKGLVTNALEALINAGNQYDEVIAIGPLVMMKFVCQLTKKYGIKTTVSMNPIMIDGTGMCGGCRLTVGGKTKFACVDGPDFDGHEVDFDEAMHRGTMYRDFEAHAREAECELLKKEVE